MSKTPMLINLPPPPSEASLTPSEFGPGTPYSTTTSISELSTVAFKDGHRGHLTHNHQHRTDAEQTDPTVPVPLDPERAERISRLAGLERVSQQATGMMNDFDSTTSLNSLNAQAGTPQPNNASTWPFVGLIGVGGSASNPSGELQRSTSAAESRSRTHADPPAPTVGFFSAAGEPLLTHDRSTVGSASATASLSGHTWASSSDMGLSDDVTTATNTTDKMSVEDSIIGPSNATYITSTASIVEAFSLPQDLPSLDGESAPGEPSPCLWDRDADDDDTRSDIASLVAFGEGAQTPAPDAAAYLPQAFTTTSGVATISVPISEPFPANVAAGRANDPINPVATATSLANRCPSHLSVISCAESSISLSSVVAQMGSRAHSAIHYSAIDGRRVDSTPTNQADCLGQEDCCRNEMCLNLLIGPLDESICQSAHSRHTHHSSCSRYLTLPREVEEEDVIISSLSPTSQRNTLNLPPDNDHLPSSISLGNLRNSPSPLLHRPTLASHSTPQTAEGTAQPALSTTTSTPPVMISQLHTPCSVHVTSREPTGRSHSHD